MPEIRTETMTVNMGPQHPSTHGVLRLVLELDGETIVSAAPTIGYLHTGIEKTAEQKKFQQVIPLVERMDYLSAQSNAYAYCLSVEKLLGLEMPERVKWIRVLMAELQRINSHLVWLGTHAMEVGAISVMLYCFRERELLLDINERIAGFRMFPSYIRVGGLREDLPRGFHEVVTQFLDSFPAKLSEYEGLLTKNDIYRKRTRGVGILSLQDCIDYSLTGPIGRASGWSYDVRKMFPYGGYDTFDFQVPLGANGDVYDRYLVRIAEMRESVGLCRQALSRISPAGVFAADAPTVVPPPKDRVYTEMEALIQHFLIYSQGFTVPAGDAYVPVEGPRGEQGFYVVADGTNRPWRLKARSPSLLACQALSKMIVGGLIADVIAVIGSIDVVMGDVEPMGATGARSLQPVRGAKPPSTSERGWGPASANKRAMGAGATVGSEMTFHPKIDYRELHRSKRQMPIDDGHPFAYTPENRERFEAIATRYPADPAGRRSAILPALYLVQRQIGYVSLSAVQHVAQVIGCTPADVEDVVTFYTMFYTRPVGKYVVQVCRTLPCALRGAERVTEELMEALGIEPSGTDAAGVFTLMEVECLGACDRAPLVMINDSWHECLAPEDAKKLIDDLRARGEEVLTGCHHQIPDRGKG